MPPHLLTTFANGLLMGKIMAFSPVNIPTRLNVDDHYQNYTGVTEDINKAILRLGAQSVTLLNTLRDPTQLRRHQCATRQQHPPKKV